MNVDPVARGQHPKINIKGSSDRLQCVRERVLDLSGIAISALAVSCISFY